MEKNEDYYLALDKRSKEYKDWKKSQPVEGLGDVIEKVTEATGIKKAVKWIAGDDCGCDERKEKLNKLFPSRFKAECLQKDEYEFLKEWYKEERSRMKPSEQRDMLVIYNRVFKTKQQATTCASCLRDINAKMKRVFETYND
jgi:hypothetical protein